MNRINKPIAIVTGVTGCIGSAIASKLIEDGFFVVGLGRNKRKGRLVENRHGSHSFHFFSIDVCSYEQVRLFFRNGIFRSSAPRLLVACAGILELDSADNLSIDRWNKIINTNLSGTYYFIRECLKMMKKVNCGMIIPVGSRWGTSGAKNASAYSASKSALRAMVKSLQLECVDTNVRCVLVSPGSVSSKMSDCVEKEIKEKLLDAENVADLISYVSKTPEHVIFDEIFIKAFPYDYLH